MNSSDSSPGAQKKAARPPLPKGQRIFLWATSILAFALFLTPTFFVVKYNVVDHPLENRIASRYLTPAHQASGDQTLAALLAPDPNSAVLQTTVVLQSPDPELRHAAVDGMAALMRRPGISFLRPMEAINVKTALAHAAMHDTDPDVRAAADRAMRAIASQGVVISR